MKRFFYIFLLSSAMVLLAAPTVMAFPDTAGHWARPQIDHLYSRAIINGYPDGFYRPQGYISRQEFIVVLVNAIHKDNEARQLQKGQASFSDDAAAWGKGYIELARELGITAGDNQGRFNPDSPISREEAVTMLVNCLGQYPAGLILRDYSDKDEISPWARDAVTYAAQISLSQGYPDGSFRPRQNITRAEAAILFEQFLDYKGDCFRFYGNMKSINLARKQAVFTVNGKDETFELSPTVSVYKKGSVQPVSELALPAPAYFDVNNDGQLAYVMLTDEYDSPRVNLTITRLPDYYQNHSSGTVKIMQSEGEVSGRMEELMANPGVSLDINRDAMKAGSFSQSTGASGRGQLVAVIDSGIDAGHPDLHKTPEGFAKIIDFVDLTDEGKVDLSLSSSAPQNMLPADGKMVDVSGITNLSRAFRYGFFDKSKLPDYIQNLLPAGKILVVAVAGKYFNKYDTLYIDMDGDGNIKEETPLQLYREKNQVAAFVGSNKQSFNIVISEIDQDGQYARLGFDTLGHGTEVAGIIAGNGKINGIAPSAQLLPIKIMDGKGQASLENLRAAMSLAAERGAKIAVLSMGQYTLSAQEQSSLANLAGSLWKTHGVLFCVAAGNNGPGLGTVAQTASIKNLLSVGAYATPEMWSYDYGCNVKTDTLFDFSSVGPGVDGITAPMVVAPGSAVTAYPMWSEQLYRLDQGTSMAAPHVAGAAALLMDAVSHKLFRDDPRAVWMALLGGAVPLEGLQPVEQGYGAINLVRAWDEIDNLKEDPLYYSAREYSPGYGYGAGLFSRSLAPGQLNMKITNNTNKNSFLAIGGLSSWIVPSQYSIQIPAGGERNIDLSFGDLKEPGLYSDFLVADDVRTPGWDLAVLQAVIVPFRLTEQGNKYEDKRTLYAGEFQRYFFDVPAGTEKLEINLSVPKGRARMYVITPDGIQDISSYAGQGYDNAALTYTMPLPGTWEIVVICPPDLSAYDMDSSDCTLNVQIEPAEVPVVALAPENRYLVSAISRQVESGEKAKVSLHFWNPITKIAADGVVAIDNKLYEIKNGLIELERIAIGPSLNFNIAW
jgi:tripeptidyl-peptidase-2